MKRLCVVAAMVFAASCARSSKGPTPTLSSTSNPLEPNHSPANVCNAQGASTNGWKIDLVGDGFAPLPINTLTGSPGLAMPTVSLAGPQSYSLPGDRVFFVDATHLILLMPTSATSPAQMLPTGSYSLAETNPTGVFASLASALNIVAPPTVTSVTALDPFSTTASSRLEIIGTGFRVGEPPAVSLSGTAGTFALSGVAVNSPTDVVGVLAANTPPGTYDVTLTNPEGCAFTLHAAISISYAEFGFLSIDPHFGWQYQNQGVTVYNAVSNSNQSAFSGPPQIFITAPLRSDAGAFVDIPLTRVAYVSPSVVTAAVPDCSGLNGAPFSGDAGTCANGIAPGGPYAIKIVDPNGTFGIIPADAGFSVLVNHPPEISSIAPTAITWKGIADLTVNGQYFGAGAEVRLVFPVAGGYQACTLPLTDGGVGVVESATQLHAAVPPTIAANSCNFYDAYGNVDAGTGLSLNGNGGLYVVRVQNTTDPAYADFSGLIVTEPSSNPAHGAPVNSSLATPRADFPLVAATDDLGASYLYALGGAGDGGVLLASVEMAPISSFGDLGGDCSGGSCVFRTLDRTPLGTGTSGGVLARRGAAAVARTFAGNLNTSFVYVIGGIGPSGELSNVEHAMVLRNADAPALLPLQVASGGSMDAGYVYYRVSAVTTDPNNPGGETLASDEESAKVPAGSKVTVSWLCMPLASSYRVYRSPLGTVTSGSEELIATPAAQISAGQCSSNPQTLESFTDTGMASISSERPLPPGALGKWSADTGLATPRGNPQARIVGDELFVVGGFCSSPTAGCGAASNSGDLTTMEIAALSASTPAIVFLPPVTSFGTTSGFTPRRHFSLAVANAQTAPDSFVSRPGDAYLIAAGGDQGGAPMTPVHGEAQVVDGGVLDTAPGFNAVTYNGPAFHGGWAEIAGDQLIEAAPIGGTAIDFRSTFVCGKTGLSYGQCTSGASFGGTLNATGFSSYADPAAGARYLGGENLFRAYIYVAGGLPSDNSTTPSSSIERILY